VAIKFIEARGPELRERLLREARVLASLRHPAIVEVFDCGEDASLGPYIAMELFEGETLAERLESGPLSVVEAIRLFLPLLDGLASAHEKGIVHRDVKPANVLVRGGLGKLIDFGIAYVVRAGAARLTLAGGIIGTPAYMAPEQIRSEPVDARADIWGLAVTLLESIAGRPVFDGADPVAVMADVLRRPAPRPLDVAGLDDDLWRIFERALCRSPADRFMSAADFGHALSGWLSARNPTVSSGHAASAASPASGSSLDSLIRKALWDS
jgi:serine/threonine protein kinase